MKIPGCSEMRMASSLEHLFPAQRSVAIGGLWTTGQIPGRTSFVDAEAIVFHVLVGEVLSPDIDYHM